MRYTVLPVRVGFIIRVDDHDTVVHKSRLSTVPGCAPAVLCIHLSVFCCSENQLCSAHPALAPEIWHISKPRKVRMVVGTIYYSVDSKPINPLEVPCILIGHLNLLKNSIPYDAIKHKFGGLISADIYKEALNRLQPSSGADVIPLHLNAFLLAALPTKCSRHNSSSHPHALHNVLKSWMPFSSSKDTHVVVCTSMHKWSLHLQVVRGRGLRSCSRLFTDALYLLVSLFLLRWNSWQVRLWLLNLLSTVATRYPAGKVRWHKW